MLQELMTDLAILEEAREILSKDGAWTQCSNARDAENHSISFADDGAVCFCAVGSINRAVKNLYPEISATERGMRVWDSSAYLVNVGMQLGVIPNDVPLWQRNILQAWNDNPVRTREDVLTLFGKVIASHRNEVRATTSEQVS